MSAPNFAAVWQALSAIPAGIDGVAVVVGANLGTAASPRIVPVSEELVDTPAVALAPGAWTNIAGGAARISMEWRGSILVPRESPGDGSIELLRIFGLLLERFAAHAKPTGGDTALQFALITEGDGLSFEEWPIDSNAWYLTWPFGLETKWNPNTLAYTAAE